MPPIRVSITCLECDFKTSRFMLKAIKMAQTHAARTNHELILHNKPGGILIRIHQNFRQEQEL